MCCRVSHAEGPDATDHPPYCCVAHSPAADVQGLACSLLETCRCTVRCYTASGGHWLQGCPDCKASLLHALQ